MKRRRPGSLQESSLKSNQVIEVGACGLGVVTDTHSTQATLLIHSVHHVDDVLGLKLSCFMLSHALRH